MGTDNEKSPIVKAGFAVSPALSGRVITNGFKLQNFGAAAQIQKMMQPTYLNFFTSVNANVGKRLADMMAPTINAAAFIPALRPLPTPQMLPRYENHFAYGALGKQLSEMMKPHTNFAAIQMADAFKAAQILPMKAFHEQATAATTAISAMMHQSLKVDSMAGFGLGIKLNRDITRLTTQIAGTVTSSFGTATIGSIIAGAAQARQDRTAEEVGRLADEFFEIRPDLAALINDHEFPDVVSRADLLNLVWVTRAIVYLSFVCIVLGITVNSPALVATLSAFGMISAPKAAKAAADLAQKAIDKIAPPEEA